MGGDRTLRAHPKRLLPDADRAAAIAQPGAVGERGDLAVDIGSAGGIDAYL